MERGPESKVRQASDQESRRVGLNLSYGFRMALITGLISLLVVQWSMGQQLLYASPATIPIEFPAAVVFIPVSGRSDALDSTDETGNYGLMAWVVQYQVSVPALTFFGLHTNEAWNVGVVRGALGQYVVKAFDYFGRSYELVVEGVLGKWEHLAIGVCSESAPYTLIVCRTAWLGSNTQCQTRFLDTLPVAYSPDFTRIDLGDSAAGLVYGMFTDITVYTKGCLDANWIHAQVAAFACASECQSLCLGASFYYCSGFSQLIRPDYSKLSHPSSIPFYLNDIDFVYRSPLGSDLGFSGWYRNDDLTLSQENLFKLENSRCYLPSSPGDGCQVLGVYHDSTNFIVFVEDAMGLVASATITDVRTK